LPDPLRIPLTGWADAQLAELARITGSARIAALTGATLLGERAALNCLRIPGRKSAGGGCQMFDALDGIIALNLSRIDDRDMLPALVGRDCFDVTDDLTVSARLAEVGAAELIERGRTLGLAIAGFDEMSASPAATPTSTGAQRIRSVRPLVIDLSALWAGPLAAHLLWLAGAEVIKVESRSRPDSMRAGDPGLFALLNQGKGSVALDLRDPPDRAALIKLIRRADVVIEAARPRALLQLGIEGDALVREVPGLVWLTITGHGIEGDAANWIGFGDDTAVAGGLGKALLETTGTAGFVGDAIGDPLTGIYAATVAAQALALGHGARQVISMSGVVAAALASERKANLQQHLSELHVWSAGVGRPFPDVIPRQPGPVAALGVDNRRLPG
jgi:CoA-transferase family III